MRFITFFITTGLLAAPILPTAFEARTNGFAIRATTYSATIRAHDALIQFPGTTVRFRAANAAPGGQLQPGPALPGHVNYISRNTHVTYPLHQSVRWHSTYPGVDLVFRDNPDHFEYDVELTAHTDLGQVALTFDNVDGIRIDDATGDLILTARGHEIREPKPAAYQHNGTARMKIDVAYSIDAAHNVRFRAAAYNADLPLIIDPQLIFEHIINTTAGASPATAIALDPQGNIYIAGQTLDPNFPHAGSSTLITNLQSDAFIAKWAPDGNQLIYATFLGGTLSEFTTGLAVDRSGIAYIAGNTTYRIFQSLPTPFKNLFLAARTRSSPNSVAMVPRSFTPPTSAAARSERSVSPSTTQAARFSSASPTAAFPSPPAPFKPLPSTPVLRITST
ncbi:MAG TPA: hypothetical protein VGV35_13095 [Bryobacteraceae bacterium]|nr:hypothetical protein [Bryobacteraceae bacterium]